MKNATDTRIISELWPFIHRIIFVYTENISPCDVVLIRYNLRQKESSLVLKAALKVMKFYELTHLFHLFSYLPLPTK